MNLSFVQPVALPIKHNGGDTCGLFETRLNTTSRSRAARPVVAVVQGWAGTRLALPSVEPATADSENPVLPGIHFNEPPNITIEDLLQIVRGETPDEWINEIVRAFLGWTQSEDGQWDDGLVPPEWKEVYPDGPPDFIGKADNYTPAIDRPVKKAVQKLTRSIPTEYKNTLKEVLGPKGFSGWTVRELTPNRTRRATAVNWILYWYKVHYPEYDWS